jgi:amidase
MAEALWKASAVELAAGIRDRRFSCVEVMTSVVERIRALNPQLNAIVEPGPLCGVPVTIKVNID